MKIKARVLFDNTPVYYDVPVGLGDKTFKWLGMSVCQRFAQSNPNGGLRRRDPIRRGSTDKSLHQPCEVVLANGAFPHPQALLSDFLRDGDEVTIRLQSEQDISPQSGKPASPTKWATLAFSISGDGIDGSRGGAGGEAEGEGEGEDEGEDDEEEEDEDSPEARERRSKAAFMRTILQSQMCDSKKVERAVESHWRGLARGLPKMRPEDEAAMKAAFVDNWDLLVDLFERFAPDGKLGKSALHSMLEEAAVFDPKVLAALAPRIFRRACEATGAEALLTLGGLMAAVMLCAQNLYNDTQGSAGAGEAPRGPGGRLGAGAALTEIFARSLYRLAERLECFCVLRDIFSSEPMLAEMRDYHSDLMGVFTKYGQRAREMPVSLPVLHLSEMLYDGGLIDAKDPAAAKYLLKEVRQGSIFNRKKDPNAAPDEVAAEDEFTYPEMVEALCRHSFYRHRGVKADESGVKLYLEYVGEWSIRDCFSEGLNGARKALLNPRVDDHVGRRK